MSKTLTGTYNSLYSLTAASYSPVTVVGTAVLNAGLQGNNATAWQIYNFGTIDSSAGSALFLADGGLVTNEIGGTISASVGDGVYIAGAAGTLVNSAGITGQIGVYFHDGGQVTNASGGTISGVSAGGAGVVITGAAGTVSNSGTISGVQYGVHLEAGGTVTNLAGTISGSTDAVLFAALQTNRLIAGAGAAFIGTVDGGNTVGSSIVSTLELASGASAGTLNGLGSQFIDFANITIDSGAAWTLASATLGYGYTIADAGSLTNQATLGSGVTLSSGATLSNASGGTVSGGGGTGVTGEAGGPATVINSGYVTGYIGIELDGGGSVTNASSGTIHGPRGAVSIGGAAGTVSNAGVISDDTITVGFGVTMTDGGTVNNTATSAQIYGVAVGIGISGASGTVTNLGSVTTSVTSSNAVGVLLAAGGTVQNGEAGSAFGDIAGQRAAVSLPGGGTVSNFGSLTGQGNGVVLVNGGTIVNGGTAAHGSAAYIYGGVSGILATYGASQQAATVINYGTIVGKNFAALNADASVVINMSSGTLAGATGVYLQGTSFSTLVNAGMITATGTYAVQFATPDDLLVVVPGAVFVGEVAGYKPNSSVASTATLELASAATAGTLNGLGTQYVYFQQVTVDAGATWTLASGGVGASYTISDNGTLINSASLGSGVALGAGGVLTNTSNSTIRSALHAAVGSATAGAATVVNAGYIVGSNGIAGVSPGVYLRDGGVINNLSSGTINSRTADSVYATGGDTTLINAGTISTVLLKGGHTNRVEVVPGAVFNGKVDGGNTVGASAISTLELTSAANTGTLYGFGPQFVDFEQLTIDAGANWVVMGYGSLASGVTLTNSGTLTLSSSTISGAGTLVNNGTVIIDPSTVILGDITGTGGVTIDASSKLSVQGTVSAGETIAFGSGFGELATDPTRFGGEIGELTIGDTIDLLGVTDALLAHVVNSNTLEITRGSHASAELGLVAGQDFSGEQFNLTGSGSDTLLTLSSNAPCFVEGTRIDTPDGGVAVELLRKGDLVLTASGRPRPVRWIGWRRLDLTRYAEPELVAPIRIIAGAFGDGAPRVDLLLSPDHAVFVDGALVAARLLVNHRSIRVESACRVVTYFHVELDAHDVLLAEGLPAESYLDTGNRSMFENAGGVLTLRPDLSGQAGREAASCAPFVGQPDQVKPIWDALAARADALGCAPFDAEVLSDDPALCVVVGRTVLRPVSVCAGRYTFALPAGGGEVPRLVARTARPSDATPWVEDRRRLGVAVRRMRLRSGDAVTEIPVDHPGLVQGWWAVERGDGIPWRWTNGDALLLPGVSSAPALLEVEVVGTLRYSVKVAMAA